MTGAGAFAAFGPILTERAVEMTEAEQSKQTAIGNYIAQADRGATAIVNVYQTAAATGLGGIGKAQLASEFVHRYGRYFEGGVFWLSFGAPDSIPAEIAACGGAGALDLRPDLANLPLGEQVALVSAA